MLDVQGKEGQMRRGNTPVSAMFEVEPLVRLHSKEEGFQEQKSRDSITEQTLSNDRRWNKRRMLSTTGTESASITNRTE